MTDDNDPLLAALAAFRVRGQPMVKDEQAELWRPVNTRRHVDPLSIVTLEQCQGQIVIVANRIADSKEILRCAITADIQYVQPTKLFHHWSTAGGSLRHGLTFSNCTSANKFQQHMYMVMDSMHNKTKSTHDITTDTAESTGVEVTSATKPTVEKKQAEGTQLPPRPQKPQSLLAAEEPPEPPPPRLPVRTITPPVHNNTASRTTVAKPLRVQSVDETQKRRTVSPQLPPRLGSSSHSPPHTLQRPVTSTCITNHTSALIHHNPHHQLSHISMKPSAGFVQKPLVRNSRTPSHQKGAALVLERYNDYRDHTYEMTQLTKSAVKKREPELGSIDSTLSSTSKSDSCSSADIPLPTKSKTRSTTYCCLRTQAKNTRQGERLQCEVCDEWFYESDNVKGACRRRRGDSDRVLEACTCTPLLNCCLKRCTADSDGRYSPAWQSGRVSKGNKRRRRTVYILLGILFPCIWCYIPCGQCHRRGKKDHCWGSKHIPVKVKTVEPS